MLNSQLSCRICGMKAHGKHFGAVSCRACAAFFRRSTKFKWINEECRSNIKNKNSCFCKPCRFRKCLENGMDNTNFQYNRDMIRSSSATPIVPTISNFLGRPEFLLFCDRSSASSKIFINVQNLVEEASRILRNGCETPLRADSQLKKLTLGYRVMQCDFKNMNHIVKIGRNEFLNIIEFYFVTVAKWIYHFDEFRKLDQTLQMKLVQSIWNVFIKIQKSSNTAKYQKSKSSVAAHQKIILRNMCVDKDHVEIDFAWMSDYPQQSVQKFLFAHNVYDIQLVEAMIKLDPTDVELTYMMAQLCFEYAGKRFQGEILKITDHFQQVLSNDLHNYYVTDQRRERYFQRLTDLMKVNNLIQRSIWETRPHRELGRIFDISKLEFSHPEMFDDSEFC